MKIITIMMTTIKTTTATMIMTIPTTSPALSVGSDVSTVKIILSFDS